MYKIIKNCRICGSKKLNLFFKLGSHVPANSLGKKLSQKEYPIPLNLLFCKNCKTVQLNATADPKILFEDYVWVTGTSLGANKYSSFFYDNVVKRIQNLKKNENIFEIASNDGTFLKSFKKNGYKAIGIDPAKNISKIANKNGIHTLPMFFNEKNSKLIKKKYGQAGLIFARNVIPHVENIHSIFKGVKNLLNRDGTFIIEFHYSNKILKELHYDSIYHEHIFYFSLMTLINALKKYSLFPYDVFKSPISGGSLVLFFNFNKRKISTNLKNLLKNEKISEINSLKSWKKFSKSSQAHSKKFLDKLKKIKLKNNLFGYGASARSSTLLNYSKIDNKLIDFIIDKNFLKNSKYTAGSKIKIISPRNAQKKIEKYQYCVLLAWNFKKEIIADLKKLKFKGKVLVPLPKTIKVYNV